MQTTKTFNAKFRVFKLNSLCKKKRFLCFAKKYILNSHLHENTIAYFYDKYMSNSREANKRQEIISSKLLIKTRRR